MMPKYLVLVSLILISACTKTPPPLEPTGHGPRLSSPNGKPHTVTPEVVPPHLTPPNSSLLIDNFFSAYDTLNMTPAEKRGRAIWYQGTLGNGVFHTYVLQQRFGVFVDWSKILTSAKRDTRFKEWGLINDPDCVAGDDSTFGFDRCPGDDELLKYVGNPGYQDPACDLEKKIPGGTVSFKQEDACKLAFGTSTGAIGFRKIPNPKFNAKLWHKRNGGVSYDQFTGARLQDASIEPPYLVGMACAGCHVGFNPLRPPANPEHPQWDNISGTIGGQHIHISEMLGSGMPTNHLLVQALTNAQAGSSDTSAVPNDEKFNVGTINGLFNLDIRVRDTSTLKKSVTRQRRLADGTFTVRESKPEKTPNILKGGEDDVGPDLAVQRVFVNIGMCSKECWVNHLPNIKSLTGRNTSQTPFDIEQCRKDCSEWRALEDRVGDVISFLVTRRSDDLENAVDKSGAKVGAQKIDEIKAAMVEFKGKPMSKLELGRITFAENCASCHSSQKPTRPGQARDTNFFLSIKDYRKTERLDVANGDTVREDQVRIDWMGNDALTSADALKINRCRSLHSNHMAGEIWDQFSSDDYKTRATVMGLKETAVDGSGGGRGYMRNISLISAWATAPFLHNNAIGPTLCSHVPAYEEAAAKNGRPIEQMGCVEPYDSVSIEDRIALFETSMQALLNPATRGTKVMKTYEDIAIDFGPKVNPEQLKNLQNILPIAAGLTSFAPVERVKLNIPRGTPVSYMASLNERKFLNAQLDKVVESSPNVAGRYLKLMEQFENISKNPQTLGEELSKYSNCDDLEEDKGHEFGASLSDVEKDALIQFVKTL